MDGDESTDEFEELEEELLRWIQELDEGDDAIYAAARASTQKLAELKEELAILRSRLLTGGRKRKKLQRSHAEHHARLIDDWFGTEDVIIDGVVHEGKVPWQEESSFNRRYRMGPKLYCRLLHEIRDPVTGHIEFYKGPDAMGEPGASALHKLTAVVRILAYGVAFDAVHEYTGVREGVARKVFYGFCDWIDARYGGIFLGVWTPQTIAKELAINAARGFTGMLGSIDCTHWHWRNCPMPWQGRFQDRNGHRSVIVEAIAGNDIYFWHVFLGCPGSLTTPMSWAFPP